MVPKRELTFVLPYLGTLSFDLRTRFRRNLEKDWPYCKLKIIFRSKRRLNTLFRFKDPLEKNIWSVIIYGYTCSNCKVTYYEKTLKEIKCSFENAFVEKSESSTNLKQMA